MGPGALWGWPPGKRGVFLLQSLVAGGGWGGSARALGGNRAGEIRIWRFLHNRRVTTLEMRSTAAQRTCSQVFGRHVLAIQDTTSVRVDENGIGISVHPLIAADATSGFVLGLVDAFFLDRRDEERGSHKQRDFEDKDSRRWLDGAESASKLSAAGAVCVTVVEDREGDIYECFAFKPDNVEKLVRAAQDRLLADKKSHLFATADQWPEAGQITIDLPSVPGRKARKATLAVRFGKVEIARPKNRRPSARGRELPETVMLQMVDAREIDPPPGEEPAHWRLLTSHQVNDVAEAKRIIGFYRMRCTILNLSRTTKTKGFDMEALRQQDGGPLEKLVIATLIAAIAVMQLVAERDGALKRPLSDTLDPDDLPVLERVNNSLEGKTQKQKNPHPKGSLAFAAWVFARLGGWTGYYGKPGPIVMLRGLTKFHAIKHGWSLRDV
ncbi:MAG: IS4 family transposase [Alphaproteobacteria bacterium]|nr:IS4 family transposase [Alphaproteobacteria bacterium]